MNINFRRTIKYISLFFSLILVFYIAFTTFLEPSIQDVSAHKLILGAHRGSSIDHIENSLEAINNALKDNKYKFIEFDVQYTKDKKVILFHDDTLLRLENRLDKIENLTYKELKEKISFNILTLEEAINIISNNKKINIEIKSSGDEKLDQELTNYVITYLKEKNILENIMISSISENIILYLNKEYPEIKLGKIYFKPISNYIPNEYFINNLYEEAEELGIDYLMFYCSNLNRYEELIRLKPKNKSLIFWYFNDEMFLVQKDETDKLW
jgi:glycerophosphoryl diester phosphodiesterase